jgi:hypothetical protein
LPEPLHFLTLIDKRHIVLPDEFYPEEWQAYSLREIRAAYGEALYGLNHLSMLDVALYVSTQRTHSVDRFLHFHTHSLVWGITETQLEELCARISWKMRPLFACVSGAQCSLVNPEDLLQMVWYTTKPPKDQYQLWTKDTGRTKQASCRLNGVNAVRVYKAMKAVTLDQLAFAGGEGVRLLERSLRDAHSVSAPPSSIEHSRSPKMKTPGPPFIPSRTGSSRCQAGPLSITANALC